MTVTYRGEKFAVDKINPDYDGTQVKKIENIILDEKAPFFFNTYKELIDYYVKLEVPGYGGSTGSFGDKTALGQFTYISVEIPERNQFRVFVYRRDGDVEPYRFFDDFLYDGTYPPPLTFVPDGSDLVYGNYKNGEIVKRKEVKTNDNDITDANH